MASALVIDDDVDCIDIIQVLIEPIIQDIVRVIPISDEQTLVSVLNKIENDPSLKPIGAFCDTVLVPKFPRFGYEYADKIKSHYPEIVLVGMSSRADEFQSVWLEKRCLFMPKPVSAEQITRYARLMIDNYKKQN